MNSHFILLRTTMLIDIYIWNKSTTGFGDTSSTQVTGNKMKILLYIPTVTWETSMERLHFFFFFAKNGIVRHVGLSLRQQNSMVSIALLPWSYINTYMSTITLLQLILVYWEWNRSNSMTHKTVLKLVCTRNS